jgi:hypothetical protein
MLAHTAKPSESKHRQIGKLESIMNPSLRIFKPFNI